MILRQDSLVAADEIKGNLMPYTELVDDRLRFLEIDKEVTAVPTSRKPTRSAAPTHTSAWHPRRISVVTARC
jgi:hypothetical protein